MAFLRALFAFAWFVTLPFGRAAESRPPDRELPLRLKQAQLVFHVVFNEEALKEHFLYSWEPTLAQIRRKGGQEEMIGKIDRALGEWAHDIANSSFLRDQVSESLATDFTLSELRDYYDWAKSPLGRKVEAFGSKLGILVSSAAQNLDHGRSEEVRHYVEIAFDNQRRAAAMAREGDSDEGKPSQSDLQSPLAPVERPTIEPPAPATKIAPPPIR